MKKNVGTLSFLLALIAILSPDFVGAQHRISPGVKQHVKSFPERVEYLMNKAGFEIQSYSVNQAYQHRFNSLQLDSTIFYSYDPSLTDSIPVNRAVYNYPDTKISVEINSVWELNEWVQQSQITSFYDEQDRLVEVVAQTYDSLTGALVHDSKIESYYRGNSKTLLDSFSVSQWSPDLIDWVVQLSTRNVYDNNNKILESISTVGFLGDPILFKDTYSYDTNGDNHLIESTTIFEGEEIISGKTENTFTNHLLTASIVYASDGINFFPESRETFLYAPFGILSRHSIMAWNLEIENWQLAITVDHDYDEEQRLSEKLITYYENGAAADAERPKYDYIEGQNLALETNYVYDSATEIWSIDSKKYYYYNGLTSIPNEPAQLLALTISPNPTSNSVIIGIDETLTVHLFDISGRMVASHLLEPNQMMDLSSLPSGIYQLIALSEKNMYGGRVVKI